MTVRVLLADDHRMLRESLRRTIEDRGFAVVGEAGDGEEAVRLATDLSPDVVLMDVTMPVLDGIQATRVLRELAPRSRVLMLTMHADGEMVTQALRAGAVGYLVKDCSTDELVEAVRLAADSEVALSSGVAASMLAETRRPVPDRQGSSEGPLISAREEEVLQLVADGLSLPEVAERLYISVKTVKNHLASIYAKLDSRDRTQAVLRAVRMGIIRLN